MSRRVTENTRSATKITTAALLLTGALLCASCTSTLQTANDADLQTERSGTISESHEPGSSQQLKSDVDTTPLADDQVVNDFIVRYNSLSPNPLSDIEQGNVRTKYHAQSNGYYFELLHANDTGKIYVSINQTNESASQGTLGMRESFTYAVKAIDSSIPDNEINSLFDSLISGEVIVENAKLGKTIINYVPDKELSGGHSRGHITVAEIGQQIP